MSRPCRNMVSTGACQFGENCRFAHKCAFDEKCTRRDTCRLEHTEFDMMSHLCARWAELMVEQEEFIQLLGVPNEDIAAELLQLEQVMALPVDIEDPEEDFDDD